MSISLLHVEKVVTNHLGQKLIVGKDTSGGFKRHGCFGWQELFYIERVLSKIKLPIALDVGANIGNHAVVMAHYCSHVHAFEPQIALGIRLTDNIAINKLANVTCHPFGLSDRNGRAILHVAPGVGAGAATFVSDLARTNSRAVEVGLRNGDEVVAMLGLNRVDLIKVDVEGYEARALSGLRDTILRCRPIVFLEWNNAVTRQEFLDYGLFENLFSGWLTYSILNNHAKSIASGWRRVLKKVLTRRQAILGKFVSTCSYGSIVICPPEKADLLLATR